jgi:WhiB family redox-sensing transcriptional regulator
VIGEPWYAKAACLDSDADCFFPEKGGSTRAAKRICQTCSVTAECLDYALDNDERFGIWGGLSERERRRLKRRSRVAQHATSNHSRRSPILLIM